MAQPEVARLSVSPAVCCLGLRTPSLKVSGKSSWSACRRARHALWKRSSHDRSLCLEWDRRCTEIISVIPSVWLGYIQGGRSLWGQVAREARPVSAGGCL